ncbi:MAG: hypothetical protein ACLUKN_12805 [Bacilli bacterium]
MAEKFLKRQEVSQKGCGNGLGDEQRQQDCRRVNAEVQGCGSESDLMEVSRVGGDCGAARFQPDARPSLDIGRGEFDFIRITGANQHNLKNISLEIPRGLMVAFTGRSGSGKSSLAFDTIYAKGIANIWKACRRTRAGYEPD